MFEKASRLKIRFASPQGPLSVEDLWDIPLTSNKHGQANLDDVAKGLFKQLKEDETTSFVVKSPKADSTTQLGFEIVKHVIDVRLIEAEAAAQTRSNREKKQKLLALIAQKETEQLAGQSVEDLRKMVEEL